MRRHLPLLFSLIVALGAGACADLRVAVVDGDDAGDAGPRADGALADQSAPDDGGAADQVAPPPGTVEKLLVAPSTVLSGVVSLAADSAGDVVMAWVETPSAQRHLHIARIAGAENPPRLVITSDTALEAVASPVGQAVAVFSPSKGCFGIVYGQSSVLRIAPIAADARPTPQSTLAAVSAGVLPRLSQIKSATDGAGNVVLAWSELARYGGDAAGLFRGAALGFDASCVPGVPVLDADPLSGASLAFVAPPAGAAELAVTHAAGAFRAALQATTTAPAFAVEQRTRAGTSWSAATAVDDGGAVTAGGSVGIAPNGAGLAVAYYRRTSDTVGDLVVAKLGADGFRTGEAILEKSVLIGTAAATSLEGARVAIAGRTLKGGAVIAAAFARDAKTSELRVYRADSTAPGGFRSVLVETGVFGPMGGSDGHPLLDVAVDGIGRIHVAWRSGTTKAVGYLRLPPSP